MDATPNTLAFAERVRLAYDAAGGDQAKQVKIILTLRDPVARELAYYHQLVDEFTNNPNSKEWFGIVSKVHGEDNVQSVMTFTDFLQNITLPALNDKKASRGALSRMGLYAEELELWMKLFSRKQILILHYDELMLDPKMVVSRVKKFLGVDLSSHPEVQAHGEPQIDCSDQDLLQAVYDSKNEALYELLDSTQGPEMEQRPFPHFEPPSTCVRSKGALNSNATSLWQSLHSLLSKYFDSK